MEAIEFLKEAQRMCKSYPDCKGCPLRQFACGFVRCLEKHTDADMRCVTKVVEQWSKEHSIITNARKFKEVFGLEPDSYRCPPFATNDFCAGRSCSDCESWWNEPYKEPDK